MNLVFCYHCEDLRTKRVPRGWREVTPDTAQWIADKHLREFGHQVELIITVEDEPPTLRGRSRRPVRVNPGL